MISCREVVDRLLELLSGELSGQHRDRAERHLAQCPSCTVFLDSYRTTVVLLRRLPRPPLPATLQLRLGALLEDDAAPGPAGAR
jgi:anti-sigma factor RsiW